MIEKNKAAVNVLHVLNELKPSGAEIMLEAAGEIWVNVQVVASILSVGQQLGSFSTRLSNAGYKLFHIPRAVRPGFLIKLYRLFSKYDVIHIHTEHWNFIYGVIARLAGCHVVRTIHNNFQYRGLTRLKLIIQRKFLTWIGVVHVAISPGVRDSELAYYNECRIVSNWLNLKLFKPGLIKNKSEVSTMYGIKPGAMVFVVVGNCSDIKNHAQLIYAFKHVVNKFSDVVLLHVGTGDCEDEEKRIVKKLDIEEHVVFVGRSNDVASILSASDIYVMPSRYEGFSIALLEALNCNIPCAISNKPGLDRMSGEFESVNYFELTEESIATTLCHVIETYSEQKDKARGNANTVKNRYSPECGVLNYSKLYFQVNRV